MGGHATTTGRTTTSTSSDSGTAPPTVAPHEEGHDPPGGNGATVEAMRRVETGIDSAAIHLVGPSEPQHAGTVTTRPASEDGKVTVEAPRIDFSATAELASDVELPADAQVQFGLTQTLVSSRREMVYETNGAEVLRRTSAVGTARDAMWNQEGGSLVACAPEPFYATPTVLSQARRSAPFATHDKPGFEAQTREGQAVLARIEGNENFVSGWAAKRGGDVVHMASYSWSVPWNVEIDPDLHGEGGELTHAESATAPPQLTGEIAVNSVTTGMRIPSVEAAMTLPVPLLFRAIEVATGVDQATVDHAREALRRRNPTLQMTVQVEDTAEWFGGDEIAVTVRGSATAVTPSQSLIDGMSGTFTVRFSQVLDAGTVGPGSSLHFEAKDIGMLANNPGTQDWAFPFPDASRLRWMHADEGTDYRFAAVWQG